MLRGGAGLWRAWEGPKAHFFSFGWIQIWILYSLCMDSLLTFLTRRMAKFVGPIGPTKYKKALGYNHVEKIQVHWILLPDRKGSFYFVYPFYDL